MNSHCSTYCKALCCFIYNIYCLQICIQLWHLSCPTAAWSRYCPCSLVTSTSNLPSKLYVPSNLKSFIDDFHTLTKVMPHYPQHQKLFPKWSIFLIIHSTNLSFLWKSMFPLPLQVMASIWLSIRIEYYNLSLSDWETTSYETLLISYVQNCKFYDTHPISYVRKLLS